jgi:hypothetical protein
MGTMVDFYGKKQLRAVEAPKGDGNDIPPAEKQSLSAQPPEQPWLSVLALDLNDGQVGRAKTLIRSYQKCGNGLGRKTESPVGQQAAAITPVLCLPLLSCNLLLPVRPGVCRTCVATDSAWQNRPQKEVRDQRELYLALAFRVTMAHLIDSVPLLKGRFCF